MRRQASTVGPDKKGRRVLVVVTFALGGIRTYMRYVYSRLNREKYAFSILAYDSGEKEALREDATHFQTDKLIFIKPHYGYRFLFWDVLRELYKERYDLIHSHGIFAALNVCFVNFLFRVPHIVSIHGLLEDTDINLPQIVRTLLLRVIGFILGSANVMHHVGYDMEAEYRRLFPRLEKSKCKIIVIQYGIDTSEYYNVARVSFGDIRKKLGIESSTLVIGYLGRFMDRKGFPVLIKAVEIIEKLLLMPKDYVIVGVGSGDLRRRYEREVDSRALNKRITFIPFQYDVACILSEMDLVVMPSLWEAYGRVAAEVLCAGVPLVASDCLGLREVIKDTPAWPVPPGDPHALAKAIINFVEMQPYETFRSFKKEACDRFDIRKAAFKIEQIFDELSLD